MKKEEKEIEEKIADEITRKELEKLFHKLDKIIQRKIEIQNRDDFYKKGNSESYE
ncbi:MAG: hypothetical protein ACE5GR_05285 [Nitrosopumilus sp.]